MGECGHNMDLQLEYLRITSREHAESLGRAQTVLHWYIGMEHGSSRRKANLCIEIGNI